MLSRILLGIIVGACVGALLGYAGQLCHGTCPFIKNPWRGALYGAIWGMAASIISFYQ